MELQLLGVSVSVIRAGAVSTGMLGVSTKALDAFCEKTTHYSCNADRFRKIVNGVESKSVPPEKIANVAVKIAHKKKPKFAYKVNRNKLAVCLEVGYIFYNNYRNYTNMRDRHVLCRLSGYFEYAVNSLVQNREDQEMYMLNPSNPAELMNVPYYLSNSTRNKRTTPFVVGFRWTYTLATISCRTCR
jgi:hypothetical protein